MSKRPHDARLLFDALRALLVHAALRLMLQGAEAPLGVARLLPLLGGLTFDDFARLRGAAEFAYRSAHLADLVGSSAGRLLAVLAGGHEARLADNRIPITSPSARTGS